MNNDKERRLSLWQDRYERNKSAYAGIRSEMDEFEALYLGSNKVSAVSRDDKDGTTPHVRNICAELIEAQVNSSIPAPKVTALREQDEHLAKLVEDMIRCELDRLPMELINDMAERTVPIQGGVGYLLEWDNTFRTQTTVGELSVTLIHPKQIIPQDGVYGGIEEMDYIFVDVPQTKEHIRKKYKVNVSDESESDPDIKGSEGQGHSDDLVTQHIAYFRNEDGGIGIYSWVNDTELEYIEDYQARRLRRCDKCGAVEPQDSESIPQLDMGTLSRPDAMYPGLADSADIAEAAEQIFEAPALFPKHTGKPVCPYCGGRKFSETSEDHEEIYTEIRLSNGGSIPGATTELRTDELGNVYTEKVPTKIPFYKPDIYPLLLQKNVSVYGRFLGDSDIAKIRTQQNTINRLEQKSIIKLVNSGSYITLPNKPNVKVDSDDGKVIRLSDASDKTMIGVYDMQGNISQDVLLANQVYEESRQIIGVTDSFQGRRDATATSGKAKEFSAAQAAGRMESKHVMKNAAYASLFEAMFKFKLAYADEPRPVLSKDVSGHAEYKVFNRFDFLEKDEAGQWYWNDRFLFSCDTSAPLASNREAMWQETRMNLQTGAFGNPGELSTLILFWTKMEMLHYPGASETKRYLEEQLSAQQAQMQQNSAAPAHDIISQARADAEAAAGMTQQAPPAGELI